VIARKSLGLALLLAALGFVPAACGGGRERETAPPVEEKKRDPEPPRERIEIPKPGSPAAPIALWAEKIPNEIAPLSSGSPQWLLGPKEYQQTPDLANVWNLRYYTPDGVHSLGIAAIEYASPRLAHEEAEKVRAALEKTGSAAAIVLPGCELALEGLVPGASPGEQRAIAFVLAGRYLFGFSRPEPGAGRVDAAFVKFFVEKCLGGPDAPLVPSPNPDEKKDGG
jgi:hypothetical protein